MKRISLANYNPNLGTLIDVQHPEDYQKNPTPNSINVYVDKLLLDHQKYLNKNQKYYIICNKGFLSKKAVTMLEYFGYDVTQVIH